MFLHLFGDAFGPRFALVGGRVRERLIIWLDGRPIRIEESVLGREDEPLVVFSFAVVTGFAEERGGAVEVAWSRRLVEFRLRTADESDLPGHSHGIRARAI
jgi:hypothetical protein